VASSTGPDRLRIVVVGGGFVGRAAARLAHEAGHDVVVLERRPATVPTVPQAPHVHLLNARGRALLDALFPELAAALDLDARGGLRWFGPDGALLGEVERPAPIQAVDRARLDAVVAGWPGVVRRGVGVTAVERTAAGHVVVVNDGARLPADVVVFASGRYGGAALPFSLAGLTPQLREQPSRLWYRSAQVTIDDDGDDDDVWLCSTFGVLRRRGQVLARLGPGRFQLTQVAEHFEDDGDDGDDAVDDDEDLLAFARSFGIEAITRKTAGLRATTTPTRLRLQGSRRVTPSSLRRLPSSWVVLGDAAVSLNPVFAQGLAVGLEGLALWQAQVRSGAVDSHALWRALGPCVDDAWRIATLEDRFTPPPIGPWHVLVRAATSALVQRLRASPLLWRQVLAVLTMQAPSSTLWRPGLWRCWLGW
jgi:2-polyprenyl-6-methoxyphenol hydroxylase-like FAD-dependent oxidoreductase